MISGAAGWLAPTKAGSDGSLLIAEVAAQAATTSEAHFRIPNQANLSGHRAEPIYNAIKISMRNHYVEPGDLVAFKYADWKRFNRVPYSSSQHGNNYIDNYANGVAKAYNQCETAGEMPTGVQIAKDSFIVTKDGDIIAGPFSSWREWGKVGTPRRVAGVMSSINPTAILPG